MTGSAATLSTHARRRDGLDARNPRTRLGQEERRRRRQNGGAAEQCKEKREIAVTVEQRAGEMDRQAADAKRQHELGAVGDGAPAEGRDGAVTGKPRNTSRSFASNIKCPIFDAKRSKSDIL